MFQRLVKQKGTNEPFKDLMPKSSQVRSGVVRGQGLWFIYHLLSFLFLCLRPSANFPSLSFYPIENVSSSS